MRRKNKEYLETEITVCSACFQASCWQSIFLCENSRNAGTKRLTRRQLFELNTGEHPSYWKTDLEVAVKG
jgi:hypothetical protein